jgi:phenylalanyl-tRNA synthetase beta chain
MDQSWLSAEGDLDFFDAKGIVETLLGHLHVEAGFEPAVDQILLQGRTAVVRANGQDIGIVGELHPRAAAAFDISRQPVTLFEIDIERLLPLVGKSVTYRPLAKFPEIVRDLAVVVDWGVPARRVQDIIRGFPLVSQVYVFDVYTGKQVPQGKKSLAFSIRYQSPERTLTDEEVDKTQHKIIEKLSRELGAIIRS